MYLVVILCCSNNFYHLHTNIFMCYLLFKRDWLLFFVLLQLFKKLLIYNAWKLSQLTFLKNKKIKTITCVLIVDTETAKWMLMKAFSKSNHFINNFTWAKHRIFLELKQVFLIPRQLKNVFSWKHFMGIVNIFYIKNQHHKTSVKVHDFYYYFFPAKVYLKLWNNKFSYTLFKRIYIYLYNDIWNIYKVTHKYRYDLKSE